MTRCARHTKRGGSFHENLRYTSHDYRFTCKPGAVYAFALKPKGRSEFAIRTLADSMDLFHCVVKRITLLGEKVPLDFKQNKHALTVYTKDAVSEELPICFKIEVD